MAYLYSNIKSYNWWTLYQYKFQEPFFEYYEIYVWSERQIYRKSPSGFNWFDHIPIHFLTRVRYLLMHFNVCLACAIGYTGANCDMKCPLPMYGKDCQSMCNCRANLCDHVIGCKRLSTSNFFFTNNSDQNFEYINIV